MVTFHCKNEGISRVTKTIAEGTLRRNKEERKAEESRGN